MEVELNESDTQYQTVNLNYEEYKSNISDNPTERWML